MQHSLNAAAARRKQEAALPAGYWEAAAEQLQKAMDEAREKIRRMAGGPQQLKAAEAIVKRERHLRKIRSAVEQVAAVQRGVPKATATKPQKKIVDMMGTQSEREEFSWGGAD